MMRTRTALLVLACVAVAATFLFCTASARSLDAQPAATTVATTGPSKPVSTVITWKNGKKYGDKYAHGDKKYHGGESSQVTSYAVLQAYCPVLLEQSGGAQPRAVSMLVCWSQSGC